MHEEFAYNPKFKDPIYYQPFIVGGLFGFSERFMKVHSDSHLLAFLHDILGPLVGTESDCNSIARDVSNAILLAKSTFKHGPLQTQDFQDQVAARLIEALIIDPKKMRKTIELEKYLRTGK